MKEKNWTDNTEANEDGTFLTQREYDERFVRLTEDEYRYFCDWISRHTQEMYEHKVGYEARWTLDPKVFYVKLLDESLYSMDEIMLDIRNEMV